MKPAVIILSYILFLGCSLNGNEEELPLIDLDKFWPQGGLFYQTHLGPSLIVGTSYKILDNHPDYALNGPYIEASLGTYGYGSDVGWARGVGGIIWGTSLSYVRVHHESSVFKESDYFGVSIKGSALLFSFRAGVYHSPKLNDNKINISAGLGF